MRLTIPLTVKYVFIGCLGVGALGSAGCADGRGGPTNPSGSVASSAASIGEAFPRSGNFYIEKNCGEYEGAAGQFCTITSSNLKEIEVGTRIIYVSPLAYPLLDTRIILAPPGPGNNKAFGDCTLDLITSRGRCTLDGGTGTFTHILLSANVTHLPETDENHGNDWAWEGTYTFNPRASRD
jgi:hypothetical protein